VDSTFGGGVTLTAATTSSIWLTDVTAQNSPSRIMTIATNPITGSGNLGVSSFGGVRLLLTAAGNNFGNLTVGNLLQLSGNGTITNPNASTFTFNNGQLRLDNSTTNVNNR